ncbi:hypothetical protein M2132_000050 [Dysgonomonas sp. PH5-45]|uniref:outer membrane beta-barrel protein n=1 Tax=unclassified Dysgonomonas TaxID=2630389 RepID=UPI002475F0C2|nr:MULTISPECIES: outer membrane beta-barrel protein [unclassified Dysgonomonas]MDH6353733.1 hypothetical protein [Dysgonomonas sp. PH5-45]MDH6386636.1 hypothetical protein [Dysgonomonas sp. PH5-37]
MKKLLFTLVLVLCVFSMNAQEVGQTWVGANIGMTTHAPKLAGKSQKDVTGVKVLGEIGYNQTDKFAFGLKFGVVTTSGAYDLFDGDKGYNFVVAPFARYYAYKFDRGSVFVDGGVEYTHGKNKKSKAEADYFNVGFQPGFNFGISDKLSLTARVGFLGYKHINEDQAFLDNEGHYYDGGTKKTNTWGFDFDLSQIQFGVNYVF